MTPSKPAAPGKMQFVVHGTKRAWFGRISGTVHGHLKTCKEAGMTTASLQDQGTAGVGGAIGKSPV